MSKLQAHLKGQRKDFLLANFYDFCKYTRILPDIREQPHREMCDELESCVPDPANKRQKKEVYLAPRYSYKTSLITAFMVFCYLKFPNIRIVYGRAVHEDARDVLRAAKDILGRNPVVREVWGDIESTATIWAEDSIVCERPNETLVDPTIGTTSLDRTMTGKHPDLVILDDLVTDVNVNSPTTTMRSRTLLESVYPVLPPYGSIIVSGTRWAANDIYGWLMDEDDRLQEDENITAERLQREVRDVRQWDRYVRSVDDGPDGTPCSFFPDKLGEQFIEQQRLALRNNMLRFSSWYYNQPYETGTKLFPRSLIHYFEAKFYRNPAPHLLFPDGMLVPIYVTMTIDPALTNNPKSDFTGIVVVGCDYGGIWYILWAEAIKKVPSDAAKHMVNIARVFTPAIIGIEAGMADPEMVSRLTTGLKELDIRCPIQSYSALQDEKKGHRGKDQRIEALQPIFESEMIYLRKGAPLRDLLTQMDGYPSIDHDDVLDALAMQRLFVKPCKYRTETEQLDAREAEEEADSWGPLGPPVDQVRVPSGAWIGRSTQGLSAWR